ncbi:GLPGLI family protein [Bacteroides helcogenes]|uniref:GLPGLI family protein n=1 Tax=Bacteroides helcogenes (strain ATCC 35417 / DSM 20613 / JCM 6297 / CCUG 15421 / P 36-108) TaxID=693979 RepID=E6STE2_BACT6|nr:GLPGLI family protein [Bacteroides helcogenes]ADV43216.1 hypothetical protein Bache_1206 [Bacteroides helcogenes P 36-108]MDY5239191.1 GLPGLI family protein [Bacteroides helcogenes]
MRLYLFTFILLLNTCALCAQEVASLECHYTETFKDNLNNKGKISQDEMILKIGKASSEFYSLWRRGRDHITDSLKSKGASMNDIIAAREKIIYPISVQYYSIYKNYPQKGMITQTDNLALQEYMCTEKMQIPQWQIEADRCKILGFNCQKAVTTFYGRQWTAWFTLEIPFQDGPWKLHGLPGLILQAEDTEKDYCFKCVEIRKVNSIIKIPKKHYIKCNKEEFDKAVKEYNGDMASFMRKQGKSIPIPVGGNEEDAANRFKKSYNYIER